MLILAYDLETHRFSDVCKTPPPICLSYAEIVPAAGFAALQAPRYEIGRTGVLPFFRGRGPAVDALVQWFRLAAAGEAHIIGANTSYDIFTGIVGAYQRDPDPNGLGRELFRNIVAAYDANAVTDVLVRQKLIDLASGDFRKLGNYNLTTVARRHGAKELDKRTEEEGGWRTRFAELEWLEPKDYPREAYEYSLEDAIATAQAWIGQARTDGHRGSVSDPKIIRNFGAGANALLNEFHQVRAALVLADMSNYGLRTDPRAVAEFKREVDEALDEVRDELLDAGLIRREYKKNKEGIEAYIAAKGYSGFARTPSGALSMPRKALEATGDPLLRDIANWAEHVDAAKEKRSVVLERLVSSGLATCEDHRNTKMAAWRQYMAYVHPKALELDNEPRECPRTDTYDPKAPDAADPLWCVKTDAEACDASGDPLMQAYAEYAALGKALSTDIPILESGLNTPIHSYFEVLLETGRTSSSKPNIQNARRLPGLRECFVPREGYCFADCDYPSLELHTLAQTCRWVLGYSILGDALSAGRDPHLQMGAKILGISYEEAKRRKKEPEVSNARTAGKGVNFGAPGGLGKKTFAVYAYKSYGIRLNEDEAADLIKLYRQQWTEMPEYFKWIESLKSSVQRTIKDKHGQIKTFDGHNVVQPWSGRLRAGASYCAAANSPFQGLGADVAKEALWLVFKAQYGFSELGEQDPMFLAQSHIANFVHDQIISEVKEEYAHEAGWRLAELMDRAARVVMPDSTMTCEPTLSRQWSKKAVTLYRTIVGGRTNKPEDAARDERGRMQLAVWDMFEVCAEEAAKKRAAGAASVREALIADEWPCWVIDTVIARPGSVEAA